MKNLFQKMLIILIAFIQFFSFSSTLSFALTDGDTITLEGDHECDSLVEYYMDDYNKWSYKIVWYVYYINNEDNKKYPAFCVEPEKEGVGTGYTSYNATIRKETDNVIWRILKAGYMGSTYNQLGLECDDDLYSATKIALHCYAQNISPYEKYILGTRSVDGNSVEEIQRRGQKVLDVATNIYNYGLYGNEVYEKPVINLVPTSYNSFDVIDGKTYYTKTYNVTTNKPLISYNLQLDNAPSDIKIFDLNNNEISSLINISHNSFKIAIPAETLINDMSITVNVRDAKIRTQPVFYCDSGIADTQNYVTYTSGYEYAESFDILEIKPTGSFEITKIDADDSSCKIENVEFRLESISGDYYVNFFTDQNGYRILEDLPVGNYLLTEINAAKDYVLVSTPIPIEIKYNETSSFTMYNEKEKGTIQIKKISKEYNEITGLPANSPLANVEFEIYDESNNLVCTTITLDNGIAYSTQLPKGKYSIKEVKTADGYIITDEIFYAEIKENGEIVEIEIANDSKQPEKPVVPEEPEPTPTIPNDPETPDVPDTPEEPELPDQPDSPPSQEPEQPDLPTTPEQNTPTIETEKIIVPVLPRTGF